MDKNGITQIAIAGYRSLRNVTWQPGRLNVVIGPNASGKSNLLKCLQLITKAADGGLEEYIDSEGGIGSIAWDRRDREIDVDVDLIKDLELRWNSSCSFVLQRLGNSTNYKIKDEEWFFKVGQGIRAYYERDGEKLTSTGISPETERGFRAAIQKPELLIAQSKSPFVEDERLQLAHAALSGWWIMDDVHTDWNAPVRQAVTSRRETVLSRDGQNLPEVLHSLYETDYDFKDRIDAAMYAAFGDAYRELAFPPGAEQQIQLGVRWKSLSRPETAANLSDGTLRFLLLITALSVPDLPPLIAIDEPETGLHPSMMRIIAEYAADAALRSQIIFTTHSAAFLDVFSRENPPTTTLAKSIDGETQLTVVDPKLLSSWLKDYSLGTLYRTRELEQMPPARETVA